MYFLDCIFGKFMTLRIGIVHFLYNLIHNDIFLCSLAEHRKASRAALRRFDVAGKVSCPRQLKMLEIYRLAF